MNVAKYAASIFVSFLGFSANAAFAGTFTYDGYNIINQQFIIIQQVYAGTPLSGGGLGGNMGQILLHGSGPNSGQDLAAWCLDPLAYITDSGVYNIGQLPPTWAGGPALTQNQINQINSLMYNANSVVLADINASAAIQLAIWQVEFGEYFQYNTNNDIKNLATTYIGHVTGGIWNPSSGGISLLLPPDGGGGQVLGFATPSAGPDPTPLPSSVILFGSVLGAGYLGLRRRRAKLAGHFAVVVKAAG